MIVRAVLRWLAVALLALVAVASALAAWGALRNLWAGYRDSPAAAYVLFGAPAALVSVAAVVAIGRLLRRRP